MLPVLSTAQYCLSIFPKRQNSSNVFTWSYLYEGKSFFVFQRLNQGRNEQFLEKFNSLQVIVFFYEIPDNAHFRKDETSEEDGMEGQGTSSKARDCIDW